MLFNIRKGLFASKKVRSFVHEDGLYTYNKDRQAILIAKEEDGVLKVRQRVVDILGGMLRKLEKEGYDIIVVDKPESPYGDCVMCFNMKCIYSDFLVRSRLDKDTGKFVSVEATDLREDNILALDEWSERVYPVDEYGELSNLITDEDGTLVGDLTSINRGCGDGFMSFDYRLITVCKNKMVRAILKGVPWGKILVATSRISDETIQWSFDIIADINETDIDLIRAAMAHLKDNEVDDQGALAFGRARLDALKPDEEASDNKDIVLDWDDRHPDFRSEADLKHAMYADWYDSMNRDNPVGIDYGVEEGFKEEVFFVETRMSEAFENAGYNKLRK